MLEAMALDYAAVALSFPFFGAVVLGCGSTIFRHSVQVEKIPAEIRQMKRKGWVAVGDEQSKRQY